MKMYTIKKKNSINNNRVLNKNKNSSINAGNFLKVITVHQLIEIAK